MTTTQPRPRLSELLLTLYEALYRDEQWVRFLTLVRDAFQGNQCALFLQGLSGQGTKMVSLGDPTYDRLYTAHYGSVNPWFADQRGRRLVQPGNVVTSDWLPSSELKRTEFHADWLQPQDMFFALNGFIDVHGDLVSNLAIARPSREGSFDREDIETLQSLVVHLRQVAMIQRRLSLVSSQHVLGALAGVPYATLLLDDAGRVVFANGPAERMLSAGDGLSLGGQGELRARTSDDSGRVRRAVAVARQITGGGTESPRPVVVPRLGKRPLVLLTSPIPARELVFDLPTARCLVLVCDPDLDASHTEDDLRSSYGLSRRQAQLARLLLREPLLTLEDAADRLELSRESAKTHLRALYTKTRTSKQTELVRVLLMGVPLRDLGI